MTMECSHARRILAPRPGDHDPHTSAQDALDHLQTCPECAAFFQAHAGIATRANAAAQAVTAPAWLAPRIRRALGLEPVAPVRSRSSLWLGGLGATATAVFALVLGPPSLRPQPLIAQPFVAQALTEESSGMMESEDPMPLAAWFASMAVSTVDIPALENATLRRGRVTTVGGTMSAAVDYETPDGVPLTYIEIPNTDIFLGVTESEILSMRSNEWQVAMWAANGTARAVISTMERDDLVAIAEECRRKSSP